MKIRWIPEKCYGCRACELACSFHHQGAFSPGGGSIRAFKNHQTGEIHWKRMAPVIFARGGAALVHSFCNYEALEIISEK